MENNYTKELHDLEMVYNSTLEKIDKSYSSQFDAMVILMEEFIESHKLRNRYITKLNVLQSKLKCEEDSYDEKHECCC